MVRGKLDGVGRKCNEHEHENENEYEYEYEPRRGDKYQPGP